MNKMKQKRLMALFLAASMSIPTIAFGADASDFKDFPNDWSTTALKHAVTNGLLSGDNGIIRAKDNLTRAELAAIVNRTISNSKEVSLSKYTDVPSDAWYYKDMAKAVHSGLFVGDGDKLNPNKPVTREEVFAVLARCFALEKSDQSVINSFSDKENISYWAKEATASMITSGYVKGDGDKLNPKANITRAEFSQIVYNMAGNFANQGETLSNDVKGNLMVRGTDTKLKDMKIEGDLILADGANNVTLDNVEVTGKILLRGGLENVVMTNTKAAKGMKVALPSGTANVSATKSDIGNVTLQSDTVLSGDWKNVVVSNTANVSLKNGSIDKVTISENAKETVININENSKVSSIQADGSKSVVKGEGKVNVVTSKNNDVSILTKDTKLDSKENKTDTKPTEKTDTKVNKTDTNKTTIDKSKSDKTKSDKKKSDKTRNKKNSSNSKNKDKNKDKEREKNKGLSDGTWYGTGTWSRYYNTEGPNVVKVVIEKGVIKEIESVKFTDDEIYKNNGIKVLKFLKGTSDVSSVSSQLDKKSGSAYDAVSHATETAKGYVSAVQNALDRSKQYSKDNVKQEIGWIEFDKKPKTPINYGDKLDLSVVKLKLHMMDGSEKVISYNEFAKNNIKSNYENGLTINKETQGVKDNTLDLYFKNETSKLTLPIRITMLNKSTFRTPTHILLTYTGGETKKIDLSDSKFTYTLAPEKTIEKVEIFDNENKLSDGTFDSGRNEWDLSLSKIPVGDGYTAWKFKDYYLKLDTTSDTSEIVDFNLDTSNVKLNYAVGEKLDLSKLKISAKTKNGNPQSFNNLSEAIVRGFKINPVSGYELKSEDGEEKEIKVSYENVSRTFKVNVKDYTNNAPTKVELYNSSGDTLIKTIDIDNTEWQRNKGCLMIRNIEISEKYKDWNKSTFSVKLYNKSGTPIGNEEYNTDKTEAGFIYEIDFPKYTKYYSDGGYLKLVFTYKADTTGPSVSPTTPTTEEKTEKEVEISVNIADYKGKNPIASPDYDIKLKVKYDEKSGEIISVEDNGTESGVNKTYWTDAKAIFKDLKGKTKSNIDSVDAISTATVSSDAIKDAVKKALEKNSESTVSVSQPSLVAEDMRSTLTFASNTNAVFTVSRPKETDIFYTLDGSNPTLENGKKN